MTRIDIKLKKKSKNYYAEAVYDMNTNVVTLIAEKTKISSFVVGKISAYAKKMRMMVEKNCDTNGILQKDIDIFTQDKSDTPLSTAALVVAGFTNGLNDWEIIGGDFPGAIGKLMGDWMAKKGSLLSENTSEDESTYRNASNTSNYRSQNVIFYGVPGCGKSQKIKETLTGVDDKFSKRILFHPEYTYSDFIGQLRPDTSKGQITYKFIPGPFTEILRDAYSDPDHEYFLIIEEINRGNAPAIFGDVFQLLDRSDKDDGDSKQGESEYAIYNKDILDYLNDELQKITNTTLQNIKIPRNLTIFATMNTCDQNVFTLDTAFKRRWRMCRIKNDFEKDKRLKDWRIQAGGRSFSWIDFAKAVNEAILNNCNDGSEAEDKQLGSHFVQASDVKDAERFAEKVLMYLWDDVAKYDKSQLFDTNRYKTLDGVIEAFVKGENVFSPNCTRINALYETMQQESAGEEGDNSLEHQTEGADGSQDIAAGNMTGKDEE